MTPTFFRKRSRNRSAHTCRRSFRPLLEALEDRLAPATYTWIDADNTLLVRLDTGEGLIVTETSGSVDFALTSGTFTQSGGDTAPGGGTNITLNSADLASSVDIDNFNAAAGTNFVTFSGAGALTSAFIDVTFDDTAATGSISLTGGFDLSATTKIRLVTKYAISVGTGSVVSTTGSGSIKLSANQQQTPTSGGFFGVEIAGTISSVDGPITIEGRGGTNGGQNLGVLLTGAALVTSANGDIQITGQGGDNALNELNVGVFVTEGATVSSTGTGMDAATITIEGTGGDGLSSGYGVAIWNTSTVTSVDGKIDITGVAANGDNGDNYGVTLYNNSGAGGGVVSSTGLAQINIDGTGGGLLTRWNHFRERLPNAADTLLLGDVTLTWRWLQTEHALSRVGVGMTVLDHSDLGAILLCGVDVFPIRPVVCTATAEAGFVGAAGFFHGRATIGVTKSGWELFAGYDYLQIGVTRLQGPLLGLRLWF